MTKDAIETRYVPIENLAEHLCVSVITVRQWVRKQLIPKSTYIHVANTYRFNIPAVVEALKANTPEIEPIEDDGEDGPVQLELDFGEPI
jgi:hypothetical protein